MKYHTIKAPFDCHDKPTETEPGLFFSKGIQFYCTIDWLEQNYQRCGGISALRLYDLPLAYEVILKENFDFENEHHRFMGEELFLWIRTRQRLSYYANINKLPNK